MNLTEFIEINPEVRFGKPVISGTRITVADILGMLSNGMSEAEILEDFTDLTKEQIRACLKFAQNRENILVVAR